MCVKVGHGLDSRECFSWQAPAGVGGGGGYLLWVRKLLKKVLPDTQEKRGFDPDLGRREGRKQVRFKAKPGEV